MVKHIHFWEKSKKGIILFKIINYACEISIEYRSLTEILFIHFSSIW